MVEPYELIQNLKGPIHQYSYVEFQNNVKNVDVAALVEDKNVAVLHDKSEAVNFYKYIPETADNLVNTLISNHVDFQVFDLSNQGFQIPFFVQLVVGYVVFMAILNFMTSRGGMNSPMNFLNKQNEIDINLNVNTTFANVAGIPEAKEELYEIVDFLNQPEAYENAGAKIPRGVLLEGDPGTGKTLLARAVAGEAKVNFISASGSQFVEMFVGVGAQRVRALFEKAKQNSPCVIFIDEIDAIGGKRGSGFNSGGNDEREQTLNQILTNMDGFEKTEGIVVMAATNRIDTLDPALLRSGRFDRKVKVSLPNKIERKEIAKIHFNNKNTDLSFDKLSELTSGFSGADISNLANEAAILSVRRNISTINDRLVLDAYEKMTIGLPKKYDTRNPKTKNLVALHEAGHAVIIKHFEKYFNLQKVTMNANTGGAGGYTLFTPKDFYLEFPTKGFYFARIIAVLGGRAAEMIYGKVGKNVFKEMDDEHVSTGASNDLMVATDLANTYIDMFESYIVSNSNSDLFTFKKEQRIKEILDHCLDQAIKILNNTSDVINLRNRLIIENTVDY
jgi:cell division protease FtsH